MALTKSDLKQIAAIFDLKFAEVKVALEEQQRTWRDDFYNRVDPLLKEIEDNRDERAILYSKARSNTKRIEQLEAEVFGRVIG